MLSDDRRRWEYDRFEYPLVNGEMPETYEQATMAPNGHSFVWESSFDSARRAQGRHGDGFGRHMFDPFELFNSMFARDFHEMEANSQIDNPLAGLHPWANVGRPTSFAAPPSHMNGHAHRSASQHQHGSEFGMSQAGMSPFAMMAGFPSMHTSMPGNQSTYTTSSSSFSFQGGNNSTSESRRTTVVNGRRETIITKRDAQGNETVRRITPEGETVHVNGQLQSTIEAPHGHTALESAPDAGTAATPSNGAAPTTSSVPPGPPPRDFPTKEEASRTDTPPPTRRKKWKIF